MTPNIELALGLGGIFLATVVLLSTVGALTGERRQVGRSLAAIRAIEMLPDDMRAEAQPNFDVRVLTPAMQRLTDLGRRFTPTGQVDRIQRMLDVAGTPTGWDVDRVLAFKVIGGFAGAVIGALIGFAWRGPFAAVVVGIAIAVLGFYTPDLTLYQTGAKRAERMRKALPDALDMLTISVEAGLGFDAALAQVARNTEGDLAAEFFRVLQEMQIGMGRMEALRALGERTTLPELRSFIGAMVQADSFGIPVAEVLRIQAREMRLKRSQRAEEMAQKVPVKVLFPLIFCIMPAMFIVIIGPGVITIFHNLLRK
jgi:tight adherence protein C